MCPFLYPGVAETNKPLQEVLQRTQGQLTTWGFIVRILAAGHTSRLEAVACTGVRLQLESVSCAKSEAQWLHRGWTSGAGAELRGQGDLDPGSRSD